MVNTENKLVGLIGRIRFCRYLFYVLCQYLCPLLFSERTNEVGPFQMLLVFRIIQSSSLIRNIKNLLWMVLVLVPSHKFITQ